MKAMARFCHNVGTSLHAGVDVRRVFETEASRGTAQHRAQVQFVRDLVADGRSVAESLRATNGYFPLLLCDMVEVGERTGRIEQIFLRLGEYYDHLLTLRRNFLLGIAWPLIELTLAIVVIGVFIAVVGLVWNDPNTAPPMTFLGLYGVRGAMIYFGVVGFIMASIAGTAFAASRGWIDLDPLYRLLVMVPFLGPGLKTVAMSRLTWSLAMATDSDLSPKRAIELAVRTTQNSYYTRFIEGMQVTVGRGRSLHEAFSSTGVYPADFLDALQTGEISGSISETMAIVAKDYEERTKAFFRMLTLVAGMAVFLFVAGLIILMIFQLFAQYMGILNDALEGV